MKRQTAHFQPPTNGLPTPFQPPTNGVCVPTPYNPRALEQVQRGLEPAGPCSTLHGGKTLIDPCSDRYSLGWIQLIGGMRSLTFNTRRRHRVFTQTTWSRPWLFPVAFDFLNGAVGVKNNAINALLQRVRRMRVPSAKPDLWRVSPAPPPKDRGGLPGGGETAASSWRSGVSHFSRRPSKNLDLGLAS
jgi:hypothetical protein